MGRTGHSRLAEAGVTAREAEVLTAIGQRLTNREIADRMAISVRTVESHVSTLLRKLSQPGRPALVRLAQQLPAELPLPTATTSFVGREEELAALERLLALGPLVTLVGPAGCGKTRLALEAARRWPGQVRLADLAAAPERGVSALVAAGLGIGYETSDLVAAANVALAGRRLLLVVDNCEHVAAAAADMLAALASGVPGLHLLATSREPLGAEGEQVASLRPLPLPAGSQQEDVAASAAGRLFCDRAAAAAPGFHLNEATAPHVAAICRRLDGLPLAIELAAARVGSLGAAALAEGLRQTFALLDRPGRAGRHRSLRSAIEWSWRLLGDDDRRVLRHLAALPGEFTLGLARAVLPAGAGLTGDGGADVQAALMRLVERSLVSTRQPAGAPARFRLLEVIRAFVRGQPDPAADRHVAGAHARYWCDQAAAMIRVRYDPPPGSRPSGFDEANLLAALAWAADHDHGLADRLLAVCGQLTETDPSRQALELIRDVGLTTSPGWSTEALAWAAYSVSYLSLDDAAELAERSAQAADGQRDEALANWARGWMLAYRREEEPALRLLDQVIGYARATGDAWLEGSAWQARGLVRADAADSLADWEQAVARYVAAGGLAYANNVRYMLAIRAVESRVHLTEVPLWLAECESYTASRGIRHDLAHARRARASYELLHGNHAVARELLDAALPVFRHAGDFRCVARVLLDLAEPPLTAGPADALRLLLASLAASAIASPPAMQAKVLARLVSVAAAAGDRALAARCLGALDALGRAGAADRELGASLRDPACATFVCEGRAGGIAVITALYRR